MLRVNDKVTQYWSLRWDVSMVSQIEASIQIGKPAFQTLWEFVALLAALVTWARPGVPLAILGDNTGSLQLALSLRGHGSMAAVCREIIWRKIRGQWIFDVGHLPTESNKTADLLSRLCQTLPTQTDPVELRHADRLAPPAIEMLWHTAPSSRA